MPADAPTSDDATTSESAAFRIDRSKPSVARAYDFALGGKDNYEVDRQLLDQLLAFFPEVKRIAVDNRDFLIRATRFLVSQAHVTQYLDCGSGLPTAENTHQVVQRIEPEARVVYVDRDPIVLAHGRALLEENDHTVLIDADLTVPRQVLENETVRQHLDFSQPIALMQVATLHHYNGERPPQDIMREYIEALPSGSYVVLSHFYDPKNEFSYVARKIEDILVQSPLGCGMFRSMEEIEGMFAGLEMVTPGVVRCIDWWPDGPLLNEPDPVQHCIVGGIGRKP